MSHLPENHEDWPSDPYEVLNVEKNIEKRELKKAYTRLIRVYKPSHHPEHFRKVREAYDEILDEFKAKEYFSQFEKPEANEDSDEMPSAEVQAVSEVFDESIELWQTAISGDFTAAVQGLYDLYQKNPDPDVTLKLYWLLKISGHPRIELIKCLKASLLDSVDYKVVQALFREINDDQEWVVTEDYLTFLKQIAEKDVSLVRQFILRRWEIFFTEERFEEMGSDLENLRPKFALASEEEWAIFLLTIHKFISFAKGPSIIPMLKKYHSELESIPVSAGGNLDGAMDYYEFLRAVRKVVRKASEGSIPAVWLDIIKKFWTGSEKLYKDSLRDLMINWCINPMSAISSFSGIPFKDRPILVAQINRIVYTFALSQGPYIFLNEENRIDKCCKEFFRNREGARYPVEKLNILEFCLNEDIQPDSLYDYVVNNQLVQYRWIVEMAEDLHQAVYMCCKSMLSYSTFEELNESNEEEEAAIT